MNTEQGFKQFIESMKMVLDRNQEEKGDSWWPCDIEFLKEKLKEEMEEYDNETKPLAKAEELLDIANVCMMLYNRHISIWADKVNKLLIDEKVKP